MSRSSMMRHCGFAYQEALRIGKAALSTNHPDATSILNKLRNLFCKKGDFDSTVLPCLQGMSGGGKK